MLEKLFLKLRQDNLKIAVAESCTGGLLASAFIDMPGASDVFDRGFVTYSNESKIEVLKVDKEIIKNFGAVSKECAINMAKGTLKNSGADFAISTTGIAGPDGGSKVKPVGTVYLGFYNNKNQSYYKLLDLSYLKNRNQIREETVNEAIKFISDCLLKTTNN